MFLPRHVNRRPLLLALGLIFALMIGWVALRPSLVRQMVLPRLALAQPVPSFPTGWSLLPGLTVGAVAISPDGRVVWGGGSFAFASFHGKQFIDPQSATIQAWDAHSGKPLYALLVNNRVVQALAVSPDGRLLASSGWNENVSLWDTSTRRLLWNRSQGAVALTFAPDSKTLAVGGELWNVMTGRTSRVISHDLWDDASTAFSPDGKLFACVSGISPTRSLPGRIRLNAGRDPQQGNYGSMVGQHPQVWNIAHGTLQRTLPYNLCQDVAFSPDGKSLACLCSVSDIVNSINGAAIYIVNSATGTEKWRWIRRDAGGTLWGMNSLIYSPDGKWLAGYTLDGRIVILNASRGTLKRILSPPGFSNADGFWMTPSALAFSQDGKTLVARGSHHVQVWDTAALR